MFSEPYPVVPPLLCAPGGVNVHEIESGILEWLHSAAFRALLTEFGGKPCAGSLAEMLTEVERFSASVWDYRRGAERSGAVAATFPRHVEELVRGVAPALGLTGRNQPSVSTFDHVLQLGGGVRTSLARAHHLAGLLGSGVVTPAVTGLGSFRALNEFDDSSHFGLPACPVEADAVEQALRLALGITDDAVERVGDRQGGQWRVRTYLSHRPEVKVLAAPPSRPGARANTGDTFIGWAEVMIGSPAGARLLLVTTDQFVPFQHADAIRLLGHRYGCGVETVGLDLSGPQPWLTPPSTSAILQEVRSTIRSMHALYVVLAGG